MKVQRWFEITGLNRAALPDLKSRIEQLGVTIAAEEVTLKRAPDSITYDSLQAAADAVKQQGAPVHYEVVISGKREAQFFSFRLTRTTSFSLQQILFVSAVGIQDLRSLDTLTEFLGLQPLVLPPGPRILQKTAFIAHRFDDHGTQCAERVTRFLQLLGFAIVTGKSFSPRPVSDKVRGRIEQQELVFVILTPGEDDTWLTQEPIVAESKDKPLFLLKQDDFAYKSGLLGDREYISFPSESIESTFISILEGLLDLGYDIGKKT
jgi:hypothetical protein